MPSTFSTRAARSRPRTASGSSGACVSWPSGARRPTWPHGKPKASRCFRRPRRHRPNTGLKMAEFLLEILAEEIPAGILPAAREDLLARVSAAFAEARLGGTLSVYSTSRRLALVGEGVADHQPDAETEVTGPPASVGYDADGNPTKAAIGFAKAHGVTVEDLRVATLPKGPYVVARKVTPGRPAPEVIGEILTALVEKMTFPRMMRWGDGTPQWIRPVHSVLVLLDGLVIPMSLFGVESGRTTSGHRTLAPGRIVTMGVADWFQKLRAAHVEPDLAVRRARLREQAHALASEVGGEPADDAALLDTWAHLVESPGVVRGSFDPAFLELPEEILVTSMREHQKMLPVRSGGGLAAHLLAVCDQIGDPKGLIARGNEWVTAARFSRPAGGRGRRGGARRPARHAHRPLWPRPRADRLEGSVRAATRGPRRREAPYRQEVAPRPSGGMSRRGRAPPRAAAPKGRDAEGALGVLPRAPEVPPREEGARARRRRGRPDDRLPRPGGCRRARGGGRGDAQGAGLPSAGLRVQADAEHSCAGARGGRRARPREDDRRRREGARARLPAGEGDARRPRGASPLPRRAVDHGVPGAEPRPFLHRGPRHGRGPRGEGEPHRAAALDARPVRPRRAVLRNPRVTLGRPEIRAASRRVPERPALKAGRNCGN